MREGEKGISSVTSSGRAGHRGLAEAQQLSSAVSRYSRRVQRFTCSSIDCSLAKGE
jgi:hypothetical protein